MSDLEMMKYETNGSWEKDQRSCFGCLLYEGAVIAVGDARRGADFESRREGLLVP